MSDDPVPFTPTDKARLVTAELTVAVLERRLSELEPAATHLSHYVRSVPYPPSWEEWQLICDQISDMVNPHGFRDADH